MIPVQPAAYSQAAAVGQYHAEQKRALVSSTF